MTQHNVSPIFDGSDSVNTICRVGAPDRADEFLRGLDARDQARFQRYFERLRDGHRVKSPENMRHISGVTDSKAPGATVHELKVHSRGGLRLYVVRFEGRWYATHGVKKVKDSAVPAEARKALRIFSGE
ncbi:MAG: type II toxin-antitoxin system RelE/ParE family toxin [Microcella pacifica]